jgi:2-keto-4-pentenoate hydratase/2-oxohepta-3-ene-1,7-dioic acid hydratase in catechol pathway
MIYKPHEMISEIDAFMSLEDGDVIMSGTPKGVATYEKGDVFVGKIFCRDKLLVESKWLVK